MEFRYGAAGRTVLLVSKVLILASLLAHSGCGTRLPAPEFSNKTFEPVRGGTIKFEQPRDAYEQKLYGKKVKGMMRKFCQGNDFKILAEKTDAEVIGTTSSSVGHLGRRGGLASLSQTYNETENIVYLGFECLPTKSTKDQLNEE